MEARKQSNSGLEKLANYFKREKIELMIYFPYSLDLAPNVYFWFPFIKIKRMVNVLTVLKESLRLTNAMFLQCHFQSGINILKIGLFECKSASILEKSIYFEMQ